MSAESHALLAPSSSHRWLNCTPSARLEETVKDQGSVYAEEGSCAHALCEYKLLSLLNAEKEGKYEDDMRKALVEYEKGIKQYGGVEMEECTDMYKSIVWDKYRDAVSRTKDAELFIEKKLDFSDFIPDSFGTADAVIISDGLMEVIDFKYGKGVEVSAVGNTQMMIYALGALAAFSWEYNIERVRMTIIQPRKSNISDYELSVDELDVWKNDVLIPRADAAYEGRGEQEPGEWCKFCKIKASCAKLADKATSAYIKHENKETISDSEMPALLELIPTIKTWCSAVEEYALARAVAGEEFAGFKVVEGRSVRKITDPAGLEAALLTAGYDDIHRPLELKSIGDLEKIVGKSKFSSLSKGYIEKPEGKPVLVPVSDRREEKKYNSAALDFAGIEIED